MKKATIEKMIRICAVAVLALSAYKCTAQDFRISTAVGLVVFCDSANPDEICFSFGVQYGELTVEHLGKSANTLPGRIASAAHMADDAGVKYADFLKENRIEDSRAIREYYAKCRALRNQFLSIMPEMVFLEIRHISKYFQ